MFIRITDILYTNCNFVKLQRNVKFRLKKKGEFLVLLSHCSPSPFQTGTHARAHGGVRSHTSVHDNKSFKHTHVGRNTHVHHLHVHRTNAQQMSTQKRARAKAQL